MGRKRPNPYAQGMSKGYRRGYVRGREEAAAEAEAAFGAVVIGILGELGVEEVSVADEEADRAVRRYSLGHRFDPEVKRTTYLLIEKDAADEGGKEGAGE